MFTLDRVVPWGRSFDEYRRMFALSGADLGSRILGCADGPASFNAEATRSGARVTSCDPLYRFDAAAIRARVDEAFDEVLEQTRLNAADYVWESIGTIDDLARVRRRAMRAFLDDFDGGRRDGRYVAGELPALPFANGAFDVAVCSHFLFLYSTQLSAEFHVAAARELCRVARDVRIFPVLTFGSQPSDHLPAVIDAVRRDGFRADIVAVAYEFQRGGNQMLRMTQ